MMICFLVSCPSLDNPSNGMISCSLGDDAVPSYEDTCSFTCNTGYELTDSDTRTCQSDGSWSGSTALCGRSEYFYVYTLVSIFASSNMIGTVYEVFYGRYYDIIKCGST